MEMTSSTDSKDLPQLSTTKQPSAASAMQLDTTSTRPNDAMAHSIEVGVTASADDIEDEEWEVDDLIPCCGLGVLACFQNCSFPSCFGCHIAGQACCCDLQYVRLSSRMIRYYISSALIMCHSLYQ